MQTLVYILQRGSVYAYGLTEGHLCASMQGVSGPLQTHLLTPLSLAHREMAIKSSKSFAYGSMGRGVRCECPCVTSQ